MASGRTERFQLSQWQAGDPVLREEFNEDNAKIDQALGTIPQIVLGTYTGDGAANRIVDLGFTPRAVYVAASDGTSFLYGGGTGKLSGGLALRGHPCVEYVRNRTVLAICESGFQVGYSVDTAQYVYTNVSGAEYRYVALK